MRLYEFEKQNNLLFADILLLTSKNQGEKVKTITSNAIIILGANQYIFSCIF